MPADFAADYRGQPFVPRKNEDLFSRLLLRLRHWPKALHFFFIHFFFLSFSPGAFVLLGRARGQGAVPELGGRAVPGAAAAATVAAARQRGAVLPGPVGRGAEGAEAVQRAEETRCPGTRRRQADGSCRALRQRKSRGVPDDVSRDTCETGGNGSLSGDGSQTRFVAFFSKRRFSTYERRPTILDFRKIKELWNALGPASVEVTLRVTRQVTCA